MGQAELRAHPRDRGEVDALSLEGAPAIDDGQVAHLFDLEAGDLLLALTHAFAERPVRKLCAYDHMFEL